MTDLSTDLSTEPDAPIATATPKPTRAAWAVAVEWIVVVGGAVVVAIVIKTFVMQAFFIPSESMQPTLLVNDRVLVNKLSYHLHPINRGDVVVFERPDGE